MIGQNAPKSFEHMVQPLSGTSGTDRNKSGTHRKKNPRHDSPKKPRQLSHCIPKVLLGYGWLPWFLIVAHSLYKEYHYQYYKWHWIHWYQSNSMTVEFYNIIQITGAMNICSSNLASWKSRFTGMFWRACQVWWHGSRELHSSLITIILHTWNYWIVLVSCDEWSYELMNNSTT